MKNYLAELMTMTPAQRKAFAETMSMLSLETVYMLNKIDDKFITEAIDELKGEKVGYDGPEEGSDAKVYPIVDRWKLSSKVRIHWNSTNYLDISGIDAIRLRDQLNKAFPVEEV